MCQQVNSIQNVNVFLTKYVFPKMRISSLTLRRRKLEASVLRLQCAAVKEIIPKRARY